MPEGVRRGQRERQRGRQKKRGKDKENKNLETSRDKAKRSDME